MNNKIKRLDMHQADYEASGKRYSGKYKTGDVIKAAPAVQKVKIIDRR